jgi:hypothetical protein
MGINLLKILGIYVKVEALHGHIDNFIRKWRAVMPPDKREEFNADMQAILAEAKAIIKK